MSRTEPLSMEGNGKNKREVIERFVAQVFLDVHEKLGAERI